MNLNPAYHAFGLGLINPALRALANQTASFMDAGKDAWEISLNPPGARFHASKCDSVYGHKQNHILMHGILLLEDLKKFPKHLFLHP